MKSNVLTIMKKEFARFFKDKRMVLTTVFMPGIMIYVMYSFMGQGLSSMLNSEENYVPQVYAVNLPDSFRQAGSSSLQAENTEAESSSSPADNTGLPIDFIVAESEEEAKELLQEGGAGCDLLAVFPEDFDAAVASYDVTSGTKAPEVELYYNSTSTNSSTAYGMMTEILNQYESAMANKFDVNSGEEQYDLASEKDTAGMVFSMMIPMLMMIFLFSGCMAVAPESIAGEKERGTIATLLVTPMKRSHLALGKILSLSVIAILSGLSSFLGTMLSLPKLMGDMEGVDAGVYQVSDYLLLLAVILSTVLVIISLISIISAFAKNVKEATTWVTPFMIVVVVIAITSMVDSMKPKNLLMYLIPLYNSVQCMNGIFSFSVQMPAVIITVLANVCYTVICVHILTRMFNSESIVFSR